LQVNRDKGRAQRLQFCEMTVSRTRPAITAADVEAAVAAVRERGLRLSAARRSVIEALFASEAPVSAEDIAGGLGGRLPRSDLTSVYRNLEVLEELGLVRHVHLGHAPGLYTLAGRMEQEYVVCERCSEHIALPAQRLQRAREAIRRETGYEVRFTHFPIVGVCPACAGSGAEP
jgi:Fur family ferric uptake transcriptional regulator